MKPFEISEKSWAKVYNQLSKEYPPSYLIIRDKMKDKLGFVFRRHEYWSQDMGGMQHNETLYLDFYDEKKRTMFLLKYGEILNDN
jgi:hypothetical protein